MSGNAALLWNGLDGLINSKPFMPTASPRQQAVALMELAERDGECLGNGERRLVIRFAEAVRDYRKSDRERWFHREKKRPAAHAAVKSYFQNGKECKEGYSPKSNV